jgi:hypothetical protein
VAQVATRVALLVGALCALAWFAHGFRALDLQSEAAVATHRAQESELSPSDLRRALRKLEDARSFNADQDPLLREGFLLAASQRRERAYRVARRLIAAEPENAEAWFLARLAAPDRRHADYATRQLELLNPIFARQE